MNGIGSASTPLRDLRTTDAAAASHPFSSTYKWKKTFQSSSLRFNTRASSRYLDVSFVKPFRNVHATGFVILINDHSTKIALFRRKHFLHAQSFQHLVQVHVLTHRKFGQFHVHITDSSLIEKRNQLLTGQRVFNSSKPIPFVRQYDEHGQRSFLVWNFHHSERIGRQVSVVFSTVEIRHL